VEVVVEGDKEGTVDVGEIVVEGDKDGGEGDGVVGVDGGEVGVVVGNKGGTVVDGVGDKEGTVDVGEIVVEGNEEEAVDEGEVGVVGVTDVGVGRTVLVGETVDEVVGPKEVDEIGLEVGEVDEIGLEVSEVVGRRELEDEMVAVVDEVKKEVLEDRDGVGVEVEEKVGSSMELWMVKISVDEEETIVEGLLDARYKNEYLKASTLHFD
jgi:hypothetical protein